MKFRLAATCITILWQPIADAQDLGLDPLVIDRPGVDIVGFELPLAVGGSLPYEATATLEYRVAGSSDWLRGPDPVRLRPDLGVEIARREGFAGALWDLSPGIEYQIRITVSSPGIGTEVVSSSVSTRALAPETGQLAPTYVIDAAESPTQAEIQAVLDAAQPGDIIEIRGHHVVNQLNLRVPGTASNPIYLRGDGTGILEDSAAAQILVVLSDHWVVEDLELRSNRGTATGQWVVRVDGRRLGSDPSRQPVHGFTLRRCTVLGNRGIRAWEGSSSEVYDLTVYDNVFSGRWSWDDIVILLNGGSTKGVSGIRSTWDDTGAKITGQGHSLFHNTFSGFGDSIKTDRETAILNTTISYSYNKIAWGGDDGLELDDAVRNVVALGNLVMNTATGGSKQPNQVTGGPNYFVRNVFVNQYLRPFKLNDGPNGIRIVHNSIVQSGEVREGAFVWLQHNNGRVKNVDILNNLIVAAALRSEGQLIRFDSDLASEQWDGNAYWPDGGFGFRSFSTVPSFSSASGNGSLPDGYAGSAFEESGVLLDEQPFSAGLNKLGPDWTTLVDDFDPGIRAGSAAALLGVSIPGYRGSSRGALSPGEAPPTYGSRVLSGEKRPQPLVLDVR